MPKKTGIYTLAFFISASGWRLAGTVLFSSPRLNGWGVKEIRFVETVK